LGLHREEIIVQTPADNFFPMETQKPPGADTGLPVAPIIVRQKNGYGRMKYDRPEHQLQFSRAVFREPAGGFWLRGSSLQDTSPFQRRSRTRQPGEHIARIRKQ